MFYEVALIELTALQSAGKYLGRQLSTKASPVFTFCVM